MDDVPQSGRFSGATTPIAEPAAIERSGESSPPPPPPTLESGATLGPFVLDRPIGEGGQATVWLATQTSLQRPVALKVLSHALASDAGYTARFHREAKMAARLSHRNIVGVYDSGTDDGFHWLAMELVDGASVSQRLKKRGPFEPTEAIEIARDVARAMEAAAADGILHRDIKPQNVLLTADGTTKLADLGMAKDHRQMAQHQTVTGVVMGTPFYMSPEQALGRDDIDIRSDIYALGIMTFEMLTGKVPLAGETAVATMMRHTQEEMPAPSTVKPDLDEGIDAAVRVMAARDPAWRYPDAPTLIYDLERILQGRKPPTAIGALRRKTSTRRRPSADSSDEVPARRPGDSTAAVAPAPEHGAARTTSFAIFAGVLLVALPSAGLVGVAVGKGMGRREAERDARWRAGVELDEAAAGPDTSDAPANDAGDDRASPPAPAGPLEVAALLAAAEELRAIGFDERYGDGLARWRALGVGDDFDRIDRALEDAGADRTVRFAIVGELAWWFALDRVMANREANDAIYRFQEVAARTHGDQWPGAVSERLSWIWEAHGGVNEVYEEVFWDDPNSARRDLNLAPDHPAAKAFGEAALGSLRAVFEARMLLPELLRGEGYQDDGEDAGRWADAPAAELVWDAGALDGALARRTSEVRSGLDAVHPRFRRRAEGALARVERDVEELLGNGLLRLRCDQETVRVALRAAPRGDWQVSDGGLRVNAHGEWDEIDMAIKRRFMRREISLEVPVLSRFSAIELDLMGYGRPALGVELREGGAALAACAAGPFDAVSCDAEMVTAKVLEKLWETTPEEWQASRNFATMRIAFEGDARYPTLAIDDAPAPDAFDGLGEDATPDRVFLFLGPYTAIREIRFTIAPEPR